MSSVRRPPVAPSKPARDHRIDGILGVATVFINHFPETLFERLPSRNFGFLGAAGVSAARPRISRA